MGANQMTITETIRKKRFEHLRKNKNEPEFLILSNMSWMDLRRECFTGYSELNRDHENQQWRYMDMKIAILLETKDDMKTVEVR
jgi:hypothetical protein